MAFPTVVGSVAESATTTAGTSHTVNLPSLASGNLAIVLFAKGTGAGTINALAGWTELVDENAAGGFLILYRQCDGSEGATISLTSSASNKMAALAYEINGAENPATQAPQLSTVATGSSVNPDATTCTPTGGAKDYLWLTFFSLTTGEEADDDTWVTGTPTNFTNLVQKASGTGGTNVAGDIAAAQQALNAASLDAAAFTQVQAIGWRAYTMAIHPSSAPPVNPFGGMRQPFHADPAVRF